MHTCAIGLRVTFRALFYLCAGVALSDIQTPDGTTPTGNRWKRRSLNGPEHSPPALAATNPGERRGRGTGRRPRRYQATRRGTAEPPPDHSTVNDNDHDDVTGKSDQNESDHNGGTTTTDGRPTAMLEYKDVYGRRRMRGGSSARRRQHSRYVFVSDGSNTVLSSIDSIQPEVEMGRCGMESGIAVSWFSFQLL